MKKAQELLKNAEVVEEITEQEQEQEQATNETAKQEQTKSPAPVENAPAPVEDDDNVINPFSSKSNFETAQRMAMAMAQAGNMFGNACNGSVANCIVVMELAHRMHKSVFEIGNNIHIIQGRPAWHSDYLIGQFNKMGKYTDIEFENNFDDTDDVKQWWCRAYCTRKEDGKVLKGTKITWQMAEGEGWTNKNGSKWKTMPEQMFRYRSAVFLIRVYAPQITFGVYMEDEVRDFATPQVIEQQAQEIKSTTEQVNELKNEL